MMRARAIATVAALCLAAGSACARTPAPAAGSPGTIPHPAGADQIVLRVADEGGFVSPQILQSRSPRFSMFGDGTIVTVGPQTEIYPGPALPPVLSRRVTEEGMLVVLQAALDAGLGEQRPQLTNMGNVGVSDMATTVFTLSADGATTRLKVYALGAGKTPYMSDAEYNARRRLQALVTKLDTLEGWLPPGSLGASKPFEGAGSRVYVSDYRPQPDLSEPEVAWPLSTPLSAFGAAAGVAGMGVAQRCDPVTGSDWITKLRPLAAKANMLTPWTSQGSSYELAFRPLLPDEIAC